MGQRFRLMFAFAMKSACSGTFSYHAQDFHDALELLKSGKINEADWSEVRSLDDGNQAFQDLVQGKVVNAKIFLAL
jgi:threonine dehydrogenase-like Zn-dependent dehydrogenase